MDTLSPFLPFSGKERQDLHALYIHRNGGVTTGSPSRARISSLYPSPDSLEMASDLDVWTPGRLDVWMSGYLVVWLSGCLVVWLSGCLVVWTSIQTWYPELVVVLKAPILWCTIMQTSAAGGNHSWRRYHPKSLLVT